MSLVHIKLLIFVISLTFAALFAFLETAFTALRLFKLAELANLYPRYQKLFTMWEKNPQRILITILIANNLAHVLCSVTITDAMQALLGNTGLALAIGVTAATVLILILGEIVPKSFARVHHEEVVVSTLWLIYGLFILLYPFVTPLLWIANSFTSTMGREGGKSETEASEQEIKFLIGYSDERGLMEAEKTEMLQNVFALAQKQVKEIMIPATDMVSIEVNESLKGALALFAKYRYTRLPVYEGKEDNIIGLIHQKDVFELLYSQQEKLVREIVMPILFVPESKKINQLLTEFLEKRVHMAILLDEYGAVMGLATLEDVIEEIVGEISDEHERVHEEIVPLEKGGWMLSGKTALEDVEELLNITFKSSDSVTVAGFLAEKLQHLPKKGERVIYKGYCFQVQRADSRRVYQVLVFKDQAEA